MKIALLSTNYDLGGAAIVTRRLADALRRQGHDARMIVACKGSAAPDDESVMVVNHWRWGVEFLRERWELYRKGTKRPNLFKISTGRYGVDLDQHPFVREADVVMVNWASQGFLSLKSLDAILATGKPVIYTMHDLWPATALCHLPETCNGYADGSLCASCRFLGKKAGITLPGEIAAIKRRLFASDNLRLVAVSSWQKAQAERSSFLVGKQIEVIPHAFPAELYRSAEKVDAAGRRTIVMAAARLDDTVKDLPTAVEALNIFASENPNEAQNTEVLFVGALTDSSILKRLRMPYRHLGLISAEQLREVYSHASVVISSSKYETMGATLMEGMAAGAIPATFGDAGQSDVVTDAVNGFIAPVHTPASLAFAISLAYQTAASADEVFSPEALHADVARRFSPDAIATRYLSLISSK
jgi:glycosyltransferase involved in cell wall biosynthesis